MMHNAKRAVLSAIAACTLSATTMAAESPNDGQPAPERAIVIGQGVVCDSAQQVKHFAALVEGASAQEAINIVNREAGNPIACATVMAAFIPGKDVDEVDGKGRTLRIIEITIVAVPINGQWHVVSPTKQYAAFRLKGMEI